MTYATIEPFDGPAGLEADARAFWNKIAEAQQGGRLAIAPASSAIRNNRSNGDS
jgi:hypothetical protein